VIRNVELAARIASERDGRRVYDEGFAAARTGENDELRTHGTDDDTIINKTTQAKRLPNGSALSNFLSDSPRWIYPIGHGRLRHRFCRMVMTMALIVACDALNARAQSPQFRRSDAAATASSRSIVSADFNRDGRPDVALCGTGRKSVAILLNSGSGATSTVTASPTSSLLGRCQ
jgi:hypothetical protein